MAATSAAPAAPAPPSEAGSVEPSAEQLRSYALLMGVFNGGLAGALLAARGRLPERIEPQDLALMAVATHKLSRLVTKQRVTRPLRAPFTEAQRSAGYSEVEERATGRGLRRTLGELLTCPYCLDQWIAGSFVTGIVFAPRATRALASTFAVVAGADALQLGYRALQDRA